MNEFYTEWTYCKDSLPEEKGVYLICRRYASHVEVQDARYNGDSIWKWCDNFGSVDAYAWMKLPEPAILKSE